MTTAWKWQYGKGAGSPVLETSHEVETVSTFFPQSGSATPAKSVRKKFEGTKDESLVAAIEMIYQKKK